jgi:hypothetical protein
MAMARQCPGRYEQPGFHNGGAVEDANNFSPYVPGAYDDRNRYVVFLYQLVLIVPHLWVDGSPFYF